MGSQGEAMDSKGKTFLWNLYIPGVTVMGSHGQSWAFHYSHGKSWAVMGSHRQSWAAMDSQGKTFLWNLYILE